MKLLWEREREGEGRGQSSKNLFYNYLFINPPNTVMVSEKNRSTGKEREKKM